MLPSSLCWFQTSPDSTPKVGFHSLPLSQLPCPTASGMAPALVVTVVTKQREVTLLLSQRMRQGCSRRSSVPPRRPNRVHAADLCAHPCKHFPLLGKGCVENRWFPAKSSELQENINLSSFLVPKLEEERHQQSPCTSERGGVGVLPPLHCPPAFHMGGKPG